MFAPLITVIHARECDASRGDCDLCICWWIVFRLLRVKSHEDESILYWPTFYAGLVLWGQIADLKVLLVYEPFPFLSFGKDGTRRFIKLMNNAQLKAIANYGAPCFVVPSSVRPHFNWRSTAFETLYLFVWLVVNPRYMLSSLVSLDNVCVENGLYEQCWPAWLSNMTRMAFQVHLRTGSFRWSWKFCNPWLYFLRRWNNFA
jgi:hypothetical protein